MGVKLKIIAVICFCAVVMILTNWVSFISSIGEEVNSYSNYSISSLLESIHTHSTPPTSRHDNVTSQEPHHPHMFSKFTDVYMDSNGIDIVAVVRRYDRPKDGGHCVLTNTSVVDACRGALHEYKIKKYAEVKMIDIGNINSSFSPEECSYIQNRLEQVAQTKSDTLVVFTTCNHLEMTVKSVDSLKRSRDHFDILVVDDFSVDGTVEYLIKQVL